MTKNEEMKPFLNLTTVQINGWAMAFCPEFEVSACGPDRDAVVEDLFDMVKRNASIFLQEESTSPALRKWSKEVVDHQDRIADLFKTA
ncbi:MAG: hypothetical protein PHC54_02470 [Candidatus Omnitrophica bacterium]|nr:hypothetical protein [Candidatus Omnitrophota bacterium]MDD5592263.1 hypothetical protein [Candidatus Omnitrophota bacterium]